MKGTRVCSNFEGPHPTARGDNKAFLVVGKSSLCKARTPPFSKGDNIEIAKIHQRNF